MAGGRLLLLLGLMVVVVEAASVEEVQEVQEDQEDREVQEVQEEQEDREVQEDQEDQEGQEEEMLEPASSNGSRVSPRSSWLLFRRNSNKGENRRTKASRRTSKHGLPGPPGPPGPQGPPGLPAPPLARQQELIQQLKLRLGELAGGACLQCHRPPRVSTSFFSRLLQAASIPRRSLLELQPYGQPSESERNLQRGPSFNSSTGRYTAPVSGFYQLTASLRIECGERVQVRLRDSVRAAVCIESLCQSNLSVESVMGAAAAGGTSSVLLMGTLYLQAGEYVSVFVDNGSGSAISVLQDSLFSGILLGI